MRSLFSWSFLVMLVVFAAAAKAQTVEPVIEYYDAHDDLYFITASPAEQAVVDSGADNVGASTWSRTGLNFNAYTSPGPGNDVCRFFDPNIPPVGIHFYTALPAECAQVQATLPAWQYESGNVFNIPLPANSACASGFNPVTRYFDQRVNESWRFVITNPTIDASMLSLGWANEGVQMCSPPSSTGGGGTTQNVAVMTVDPGPAETANIAFVTVTLCVPGTATCQTIDHVQVDTGSAGLRIVSTLLPASFVLPSETTASGTPLAECVPFAGSFSWGSMRIADVQIAGEQAHSVPVQIIGDPAFPAIPSVCSSYGFAEDTVQTFLANGLLGIGASLQDCGTFCAATAQAETYFACPNNVNCQSVAAPLSLQTPNPAALFTADNNGVVIQLPAVGPGGAPSVTGSLTFGIGTQSNNGLGSAKVFPVNTSTGIASGTLTTVYKGQPMTESYFDTGSAYYFFNDSSIAQCADQSFEGLYCPSTTLSLSATIEGVSGSAQEAVSFTVANFETVWNGNPNSWAFSNLAGLGFTGGVDWGLPFFFGRSVFVGFEGANTTGGPGPYFAF